MAEAENQGFFTPPATPDPIAEQRNKKKSKQKIFFILIFLFVLFGLAALGVVAYRALTTDDEPTEQAAPLPVLPLTPAPEISSGTLEAIEEEPFGNARFASENFRIGDVAIAGEAEFLLTEDTIDPLALSGIRGDVFAEKNSSNVNLIVSWRTNKLAKSEIVYSKGAGQPERTVRETNYGLTHSLIIPELESGTTYVYTVKASDRFGSTVSSEQHAIYTGAREASLFDLIAGAVGDIFGWALK